MWWYDCLLLSFYCLYFPVFRSITIRLENSEVFGEFRKNRNMEMEEEQNEIESNLGDDATESGHQKEEAMSPKVKKKSKEPGIIYLSRVPPLMNVKIIRNYFSDYGDVGKIFLQPDGNLHFNM